MYCLLGKGDVVMKNKILKLLLVNIFIAFIFTGCLNVDKQDLSDPESDVTIETESEENKSEESIEPIDSTESENISDDNIKNTDTYQSDDMVTEPEPLEENIVKYDLKEYSDVLPEDLGGNLSETLASLLYPNNPSFSYSDDEMMYMIGDGDIELGASVNNDGYMVIMLRPVEIFSIYGIELGITESDAEVILQDQGITKSDNGYYMITDRKYIMLEVLDGYVNKVTFCNYLG